MSAIFHCKEPKLKTPVGWKNSNNIGFFGIFLESGKMCNIFGLIQEFLSFLDLCMKFHRGHKHEHPLSYKDEMRSSVNDVYFDF